jgi:protein-tyrosine phosphatase
MNQTQPLRVLFVCLGNICRSPLAEVVIKGAAQDQGLAQLFHFESAGTGDWHVGKGADVRSAATATQHGLSLAAHKAQRITRQNVPEWDVFVAMDNDNKRNLIAMGVNPEQVIMMRSFESEPESEKSVPILDVPDPYYGGVTGFEDAYQMLMQNADGLLQHLQTYRG